MRPQELTMAEVFRPKTIRWARFYDTAVIICGSLVIALSAQVSFRLPFSPVPVTGQTFAVLMIGALLGSKRGAICIITYLLEGAAGLPVFASGGAGLIWILGPTGGYLFGFIAAAWIVGRLCERGWDRSAIKTVIAMVIGNVCLHFFGFFWLSCLALTSGLRLNISQILSAGVYPFIIGDVIKIIVAAVILPLGWKLLSPNN